MKQKREPKPDKGPEKTPRKEDGKIEIFTRYIVKNGKKIYPKTSKFFRFWVKPK